MIETADDVGIRMAVWQPEGEARGALLMTQGRTEYIEKAYEWIGKFRKRGLVVCAFDWRGQGLSERELPDRKRGYLRDFSDFQSDLDAVHAAFREVAGPLPMMMFGHSMGGLAVTRFLSRHPDSVVGAILSAPMLELCLSPVTGAAAKAVSRAAGMLRLGSRYVSGCDDRTGPDRGFTDNVLTHDRRRFDNHADLLERYPDLKLGGATWGWLQASFREMTAVAALPEGWVRTPVLILRAGEDTVVSNRAIDRLAAQNPSVEVVALDGSRHEPLMEIDAIQDVAWAGIDGFVGRVLGADS